MYLLPGQRVTPENIAQHFRDDAEVEAVEVEGIHVFQITSYGGLLGYIQPPTAENKFLWGVNLSMGAHEFIGWYEECVFCVEEPQGWVPSMSPTELDEDWPIMRADLKFVSRF